MAGHVVVEMILVMAVGTGSERGAERPAGATVDGLKHRAELGVPPVARDRHAFAAPERQGLALLWQIIADLMISRFTSGVLGDS